MKKEYEELRIDNIDMFESVENKMMCIDIAWSSPYLGFGHVMLGVTNKGGVILDDEYMSKEFVMEIFSKLYDKAKEKKNEN